MRLRELRITSKTPQKQLADLLGTTVRAIAYYETGEREPNIAGLIALADFFGVSVDYLLGRTDQPGKTP